MKFKQKFLAFGLSLLLTLTLAGPSLVAQNGPPLSLQTAVSRGLVEYSLAGTGASSGDSVKLRVKKASRAPAGPVDVTVPPGSVLRSSSAGAQSMVVSSVAGIDMGGGRINPTSQIHLSDASEVTVILSAFCAEFEKDNPESYITFTLQPPDPMLACITKTSESRNLSIEAEQAAVWIYTDRASFSHINEKFPVGASDFTAAQRVVDQCRTSVR